MDAILGFCAVMTFLLLPIALVGAAANAKKVRKCPKCGNKRNNGTMAQTIKDGNKTTVKRLNVCSKCGAEFV